MTQARRLWGWVRAQWSAGSPTKQGLMIIGGLLLWPVLLVGLLVAVVYEGVVAVDRRSRLGTTAHWSIAAVVTVAVLLLLGQATPRAAADPATAAATPTPSVAPSQTPLITPRPTPTKTPVPTPTPTPTPAPSPTPIPSPTPTPTPTPEVAVVSDTIYVDAERVAVRGQAGSYTWQSVSVSPSKTRILWDISAGSGACQVMWEMTPTFGDSLGSTIKVAAGDRTKGGDNVDTDSSDYSLVVESTCPSWLMTLGESPEPAPPAAGGGSCDPNYSGYCVPIVAYDLDCADIGHSVIVIGVDKHGFDGDDDGVGCESY